MVPVLQAVALAAATGTVLGEPVSAVRSLPKSLCQRGQPCLHRRGGLMDKLPMEVSNLKLNPCFLRLLHPTDGSHLCPFSIFPPSSGAFISRER